MRKTRASEVQSFETMVKTFMIWREQIKHPDPERAVRLGFTMTALALRELILLDRLDRIRMFRDILPLDEILREELPRMLLSHLVVEPSEA